MWRVCALIALATTVAAADPSAADQRAAEANALAQRGDFAGAAAKFRAAYAEEPRAALICNVGVSYYKAKDVLRAQRYLQDCLQIGASVPPAFVATVKQVLSQLEDQLRAGPYAPISLVVSPPQTAIAVIGDRPYDEPSIGSRVLWFPRGSYQLQFHADGYVDTVRSVDGKAAQTISVSLERAAAAPAPVVVVAPTPVPAKRSRLRPIAFTAAAVTEGVAALGFYLVARGKATDAGNATVLADWTNAKHAAERWQLAAILTASGAAITAGVAGYFWISDVRVEPQPGGAVVALGGRF